MSQVFSYSFQPITFWRFVFCAFNTCKINVSDDCLIMCLKNIIHLLMISYRAGIIPNSKGSWLLGHVLRVFNKFCKYSSSYFYITLNSNSVMLKQLSMEYRKLGLNMHFKNIKPHSKKYLPTFMSFSKFKIWLFILMNLFYTSIMCTIFPGWLDIIWPKYLCCITFSTLIFAFIRLFHDYVVVYSSSVMTLPIVYF